MTATQLPARRKTARPSAKKTTPARPVEQVLLELAYFLHATKVVGHRDAPASSRSPARAI